MTIPGARNKEPCVEGTDGNEEIEVAETESPPIDLVVFEDLGISAFASTSLLDEPGMLRPRAFRSCLL